MSNGSSVVASVFVMASCCSAVLEVRRYPKVWSLYLLTVVLHMYFLVWGMMDSHSLRWISNVKDSLCNWFEGSLSCVVRYSLVELVGLVEMC